MGERRWHPSQQSQWLSDGKTLEVTLELERFEEVQRWILSWGATVEVVEPAVLREAVAGELRAAAAIY